MKNLYSIVNNKIFLFILYFITSLSIIFFAKEADYISTTIFIISGYIISFFTKKMVIVLFSALIISYIYKIYIIILKKKYKYKEGLDTFNSSPQSLTDVVKYILYYNEKMLKLYGQKTGPDDADVILAYTNISKSAKLLSDKKKLGAVVSVDINSVIADAKSPSLKDILTLILYYNELMVNKYRETTGLDDVDVVLAYNSIKTTINTLNITKKLLISISVDK